MASYCSQFSLSDILKKLIRNTAGLETKDIVLIILQLVSFIIVVSCLSADYWLSGEFGNQGLWNYCYKNGTADCCGWLDDVIGYKDFIGATRAFLIIECILYGGIFYTVYKATYRKEPNYTMSSVLMAAIGICTFLAITIYGARHKDVSLGQNLNHSYAFCAVNLGVQILTVVIGLCSL